MKTRPTLTLEDARRVAAAARAEAVKNGWSVVVAIVDDGGWLTYLERADDVQPASCEISQAKARTAALFRRPSKALEEVVAGGRIAMLSLPHMTPVEGGVPLICEGTVVGAIGVSGVQSHQDGQIAQAGAAALIQ